MKNTTMVISLLIPVTRWIRPALMTLALIVSAFGLTGCPNGHPH